MITYFTVPKLEVLDLFTIEPFGLLVLVGILVGIFFARRRGRQAGLAHDEIAGAVTWALVSGLLFAHVYYVLLVQPELLQKGGPLTLLTFWNGISSFGGIIGALIGVTAYFAWLRKSWLLHADILVQALVAGWIFGRLGCTLAHDHIGRESTFFLSVTYPEGARHNLGLYEFLFTLLLLLPTILLLHKAANVRPGNHVVAVCLLYALFRFLLEFLRDGSSLYLGLNIEQFCSIALFCLGIGIHFRAHGRTAIPAD